MSLLVCAGALLLISAITLTYFYVKFSRMIDERMAGQVFQNTSRVFTAPARIAVGQALTPKELASYLLRAGYSESPAAGAPDSGTPDSGALGQFQVSGGVVAIRPSATSYLAGKNALRVGFSGGRIERILSPEGHGELSAAELEPGLLTELFDSSREKRRPVRFEDLPKVLIDVVLSAEDKRFFEHPGFDPIRVVGAAWVDLRRGSRAQGASTISMQVARNLFFTPERTWRRKLSELLVALQLEQRFTKEQIFQLYANQVYLGNRGSFAIRGFGEAAQAYFGKDVRELNLAEAAFLAGIIRAPNRYSSAERHPERAAEARDRVLNQMVENKMISGAAANDAKKAGLHIVSSTVATSAAPYFVDLVKDDLEERFSEAELLTQSFRIYTTLDPVLQAAAVEAVQIGMKGVDAQLARRYDRWRKRGEPVPAAQVALVAIDPHTGEIRALIGGRDYGRSQLNRAVARRQPGSVFKPFVYAAAFQNGVDGVTPVVTPVTTVVDEPTTFHFGNQEYTPNNYGEQFHGTVTVREALTRSLNVATVKLAEMIGYDRVVQVARQIGLGPRIQPTPAVALGAYELTPLEVAAGYSVFANRGMRAEPIYLRSVVSAEGQVIEGNEPRLRQALDPRVAYLVTSLLQDAIDHGTGAGVRARGFTAPAAGKTGTSHDGWFAGFTSDLLCVVWVGFDDNRELGLSGASSAAPIWTEFMKRAAGAPALSTVKGAPAELAPPEGIVAVAIDPDTLQAATPSCPVVRQEYFVAGTEPTELCARHGGRTLAQVPGISWLARLFGGKKSEPAPSSARRGDEGSEAKDAADASRAQSGKSTKSPEGEKKKGFLQRVFGIFGGKKPKDSPKPEPAKP